MRTRGWLVWALAALTIPALSACVDEDAGPTVLTDEGGIRVLFDFLAASLPGGEAVVVAGVVELDTLNNPDDLFGRATGGPEVTWPSPRFADTYDLGTDFGRKPEIAQRQWISGFVPDDPRKPFLIENANFGDTYGDNADHIRFWSPTALGADCPTGPCWAYSSDIDWLGPDDSWFAVGFVRYGLQVNGLLDHLDILVNDGVVEEPDSLIPLGGALAGYSSVQSDHWMYNSNDCLPMLADANPFILGHFKTGPTVDPKDSGANFNGETDADYCYYSNGVWGDNGFTSGVQPFAPNALQPFDLPSYNYLVIWSYDPATDQVKFDEPWVRAQIGVDLDLNGNPIPHSFAPFPTAPGRELSDFADFPEFLGHPNVAAGASRVTLTVRNLKPLAAGQTYQIWLYDEVEGDATRVEATYTLQQPDTLGIDPLGEPIIDWVDVQGPGPATDFNGVRGYRHIIELRNSNLIPTGVRLSQFSHVVATIGSSDANPASSPAPVWFRYTNQNGTRTDLFDNEVFLEGSARFGFRPSLADKGIGWQPFGSGNVQFLNVEAIAVALNRLARPPLGFYYGVWLVNEDDGTNLFVGEITTPPPGLESLLDADVTKNDFVSDSEILAAGKWATWADLGANYKSFTSLYVTLEPKNGDGSVRSPSTIFRAAIPANLELPKERESS